MTAYAVSLNIGCSLYGYSCSEHVAASQKKKTKPSQGKDHLYKCRGEVNDIYSLTSKRETEWFFSILQKSVKNIGELACVKKYYPICFE